MTLLPNWIAVAYIRSCVLVIKYNGLIRQRKWPVAAAVSYVRCSTFVIAYTKVTGVCTTKDTKDVDYGNLLLRSVTCDGQTVSWANSVDHWRHFCLLRDSRDGGALVTLYLWRRVYKLFLLLLLLERDLATGGVSVRLFSWASCLMFYKFQKPVETSRTISRLGTENRHYLKVATHFDQTDHWKCSQNYSIVKCQSNY